VNTTGTTRAPLVRTAASSATALRGSNHASGTHCNIKQNGSAAISTCSAHHDKCLTHRKPAM
jgi:hypothetical protein